MKKTIKSLNEIQWEQLKPNKYSFAELEPAVGTAVHETKGKNVKRPFQARVSLTSALIKELGWVKGDKIGVFYDPDDLNQLMLAKHATGYCLNFAASQRSAYISSGLDFLKINKKRKQQRVEHVILKGNRLAFRFDGSKA